MPSLAESIRACAVNVSLPKGGTGDTIDVDSVATIADEYHIPGHAVEAEALRHTIFPTRYLRNMDGITAADQIKLLKSTIAQVGLGGLGGSLLEIFLRTGIGTIRAADGDDFEGSNLNRQALASMKNLDRPKTEAARERAQSVNPSISLETRNDFLTEQTFPDFIQGTHLAIDALGGLTSRLALQRAAAEAGIPLVTGALAGWTGYVGVVLPGHPGPADIMGQDNAAEEKLGCPSPAVTFMASLMANETVKILTGNQSPLTGSMIIIDLKSLTFETIRL